MTAPDPGLTGLIPDPGLTGLIAAHQLVSTATIFHRNGMVQRPECKCGELMHWAGAYPAHVALVVEQHTNGRAAEYIKQLESERETVTSMCSELESIRDEQAARIAELETLRRVDQDLFVQTLAIANQRKARAEKAEATIARVEKLAHDMRGWCSPHGISVTYSDRIRAALEGEQQ